MPLNNKDGNSSAPAYYSSLKPSQSASDYGSVNDLSPVTPREVIIEDGCDWKELIAGVAGNVLEWYDFAVFGYFGDVIGDVFFPPNQGGNTAIIESYAVFGGAFLARPIGGLMLGYIGDTYGSKVALVLSIFLMAFPTFLMGCLPSYASIGPSAIVLLVIVRLLQGCSVGGQLMTSLVFTLENHPKSQWGFYGGLVLATANFGSLLGGLAATTMRSLLTHEQLYSWGWRIPFLMGIFVSISGFYLKGHGGEEQELVKKKGKDNIMSLVLSPNNVRPLLSVCMIPMLWSSGFYLSFVWMAIYMTDLIEKPVPGAFVINSTTMLISCCLLIPFVGYLSDKFGRKLFMTIGGVGMFFLCPGIVMLIGKGDASLAFAAQLVLGILVSLWGGPMMALYVETFDPRVRLTSIAIGYNVAQASIGAIAPSLATYFVDRFSPSAPGYIFSAIACIALTGLLVVHPSEVVPINDDYQSLQTTPESDDDISENNDDKPSTIAV